MLRHTFWAVLFIAVMVPLIGRADTGPSSSEKPYLVPVAPGVEFTSILSVGDEADKKNTAVDTYPMAGIPDGLGAYDNGGGVFTVLMNQEFEPGDGAVHAHGADGAFVSKWQIRKSDLAVLNGEDLMADVLLWDPIGLTYIDGTGAAFSRFCSADLPPVTAFFNSESGKGFNEGRIFMNGEEDSDYVNHGRALAHLAGGVMQGTSYELPKMGRHAWENLLASPFEQDKTIVAGDEDGGPNRVYFYVGNKQKDGSPIEQAGLTNGTLYELKIDGYTDDDPVTGFHSGNFELVGSGLGTTLARPEDGAWDTVNPNRYYFVTTASFAGNSRLWRLTFNDITNPTAGGTVEVLVDGNAVADPQIKMMDNITIDDAGTVYMLEDVGNNARIGQVWKYDPKNKKITNLAQHDPSRFLLGGLNYLTQDEESSGIIEVTDLFGDVDGYNTDKNRYFLLVVQAHYAIADPKLVQGGQLLMMKVPRSGGPDDGHGHGHDDHGNGNGKGH